MENNNMLDGKLRRKEKNLWGDFFAREKPISLQKIIQWKLRSYSAHQWK
jgi:hypothetical protein